MNKNTGKRLKPELIIPLLSFTTSRSGGKGGQNVNKVESKVTASLFIEDIHFLTSEELERLQIKLKNKILDNGSIQITSQSERSQLLNKEIVIKKFIQSISKAITPDKPRKKTKPSPSSVFNRLEKKKKISEIKKMRRKNGFGDQ